MRNLLVAAAVWIARGDDGIEAMLDEDMPPSPPVAPVTYKTEKYKPTKLPACSDEELCEIFASPTIQEAGWSKLKDPKYDGPWELREHQWLKGKKQLAMTEGMKYYGLLKEVTPWSPKDNTPLAFSMTARYDENHNCGGAYVKLFEKRGDDFNGETPYSIMFGPDHCGVATRKVHFIIQYTDPSGKTVEEHLAKPIDLPHDLRLTHQYGFVLTPNGELEITIDNEVSVSGTLRSLTTPGWKSPETIDDPEDPVPEGWTPPPKMIPDEKAVKPDDWDEEEPEYIEDMDAVKPDDWLDDEPELVPNMEAQKPADWDDAEDGEWVRPQKKNPKCATASGCGEWIRPMIANPAYKGPWSPPLIPNPNYTETYPARQIPNPHPYDFIEPMKADGVIRSFNAIGLELWTVQPGTILDNFYLGTDVAKAKSWATATSKPLIDIEKENYKRESASKTPKPKDQQEDDAQTRRYLTLGIVCIIGLVVVFIAAHRLFAPNFKQSDIPKPASKDAKDEKEESADTKQPENEKPSAAKKSTTTGSSDDRETEPSATATAGETNPSKRNR